MPARYAAQGMPASRRRYPAKSRPLARPARVPRPSPDKSRSAARPSVALPEWNLADLYPAIDVRPEVKRDLERGDAEIVAFEEAYKGKLAALAAGAEAGARLAEAVRRYEALDDLLGRLGLLCEPRLCRRHDRPGARQILWRHAGEASRAPRRICCSSRSSSTASTMPRWTAAMRDPALGHYRPWLEDVRKDKPYQLEDRIEELFHEKSVTGAGRLEPAVRRDHRARCASRSTAKPLTIEPTLNLHAGCRRQRSARPRPRRWRATFKANLRTFTLITNTLAKDKEISDRWRGFEDVADSRHLANRVEREVVDALVAAVRAAYPRLSHRYYALKAKWFGKKQLAALGPQRAAAEGRAAHHRLERGARHRARRLWRLLAARWRTIAERFFDEQLDRRAGAARQAAGRVRASDRALGAPLCAAQLPGQAARRDDARA